jgi:hypothetical protein
MVNISRRNFLNDVIKSGLICTGTITGAVGMSSCNPLFPNDKGLLRTLGPYPLVGLGRFRVGMKDNYSLRLSRDYEIYNENYGGIGNTLEWINEKDSVYLKWAYEILQEISVGPNWKGITDRGLKIGDDFEKFKKIYPFAEKNNLSNTWAWRFFRAYFDTEDKLKIMGVRAYNDGFFTRLFRKRDLMSRKPGVYDWWKE